MTSYTTSYHGSKEENLKQAIEDVKFYLGDKTEKMVGAIAADCKGQKFRPVYRKVMFYGNFLGIRGYWPVRGLLELVLKEIKV